MQWLRRRVQPVGGLRFGDVEGSTLTRVTHNLNTNPLLRLRPPSSQKMVSAHSARPQPSADNNARRGNVRDTSELRVDFTFPVRFAETRNKISPGLVKAVT